MMATTVLPDVQAIRAFLRGWCEPGVSLEGLEVSYFQVEGEGASRILCEGPGPRGETLRLAARRVGPEKGAALEAEINRRHAGRHGEEATTGFARAAKYARELGLLFQVFPADRRLPLLPSALDRRGMATLLETALAGRTGGARITSVAIRVIRYKPEQKCLVRYDISWAAAPLPGPHTVYGRISSAKTFARTSDVLRRVRHVADGLLFELPEPLGVVPGVCLELFSAIPGVVLFALVGSEAFPDLCRQTGRALRQFHSLPVTLERAWSREATVGRLSASAAVLACLLPSGAKRIEALRRRLEERLTSTPPAGHGLIHHDFHGDNILVHGARLGLLDFEDCAMGDPADDVGSNWAQLTWHTLKARAGRAAAESGRSAFLQAYLEKANAEETESVTVHAALHCFLYASQCLRHPRDPARYADAEAMLAACERALEEGLR
jgi:hypothetical protein